MNYYLINPLYQGDISLDSTFENGLVKHLVFELDDIWNGDALICGTDEFICEKSLADTLFENQITGFSVSDMDVIYNGTLPAPQMKRMEITGTIEIKRKTYSNATADICCTKKAGELAVSERAYKFINMPSSQKISKKTILSEYVFYVETKKTVVINEADGISVNEISDKEKQSADRTLYRVAGSNEMKTLLFLSNIESDGTYIGKESDNMMEYESFFLML